MINNFYKNFMEENFKEPSKLRRLYPKIRLSHSLYSFNWTRNRWRDVWSYLCNIPIEQTPAMKRGQDIHEKLEMLGPYPEHFKSTVGKPECEGFYELHVSTSTKNEIIKEYIVAAKLDLLWLPYIADYKTGSSFGGVDEQMKLYHWILTSKDYEIHKREFKNFTDVVIDPVEGIEKGLAIMVNDDLEYIDKKLVIFNNASDEWENKLDGMYFDILERIYNGELAQFMKLNNLDYQFK